MPNSTGVEVARISVKVSPNTKSFRRELKQDLDAIEKQLRAEVQIDAKLDAGGVKGRFDAMMTQLRAQAARGVDIKVGIDKSQLSELGALAGAGARTGSKLLPDIGGLSTSGGALSVIGAITAGLLAIGPAMAVASTALATLPGLIAGIGIPLAALAFSIDDITAKFADLAPDFTRIKDGFVNAFALSDVLPNMKDKIRTVLSAVEEPIRNLGVSMAQAFNGILNGLTSGPALDSLKTLIDNISNGISGMAPGITKITEGLLKMAAAMGQGLVDTFNKMADGFSGWISAPGTIDTLQGAFKGLIDIVQAAGPELFNMFTTSIKAMSDPEMIGNIKNIATAVTTLIGAITAGSQAISMSTTFFTDFFNGVKLVGDLATNAFSAILVGIGQLVAGVSSFGSQVANAFNTAVAGVQGFVSAVASGVGQVIATISTLPGQIVSILQAAVGQMVSIGTAIVQGIANGIRAGIGLVKSAVEGLANLIPGWAKKLLGIHSPSTVFAEIGNNIGQGWANGITDQKTAVVNAVKDVGKAVESEAQGWDFMSALKDAGSSSIEAGFTVADSVINQAKSDLNIGGGALTALADEAWNYGKQAVGNVYNFAVSSVDEAMSMKDRAESKQAMAIAGAR